MLCYVFFKIFEDIANRELFTSFDDVAIVFATATWITNYAKCIADKDQNSTCCTGVCVSVCDAVNDFYDFCICNGLAPIGFVAQDILWRIEERRIWIA